jgi:hypothetical protein
MKKIILHFFAASLIAALFCFSGAALAKNNKGHGHHPHHNKESSKESSSDTTVSVGIGASNREVIQEYLKKGNQRNCPPGLAKKNNGCLPPGIAKKYNIGRPLPEGVAFSSLPPDLLKLLYPAPYGHQYVQVDKDILLINQATKDVIDAVTLLSAVGN